MAKSISNIAKTFINWLAHEEPPPDLPLCDFDRLSFEIRPCDVLLVEGRSRVSHVIKTITQSTWTHAALYIGRLHDIEDPGLREYVRYFFDGDPNEQLLIEALLGEGTIVSPLSKYRDDHLRICRPHGLSRQDAQAVTKFAAQHISLDYDVRQLLDLARLLLPYGILPRRWRSSLFEHNPGPTTKTVCSTMIAAAFTSVHFPIRPVIHKDHDGQLRFYRRNTRLFTPSDFDYSPYFAIIKYPFLGLDDLTVYRQLPWDQQGVICDSQHECYIPQPDGKRVRLERVHQTPHAGSVAPAKEAAITTDKQRERTRSESDDHREPGAPNESIS